MIEAWLAALEATPVARELRDSVYIYPLVNTGHLVGVALLIGSIIPLDLRLLFAWPSVPLAPLWRVLTRTSAAGLVVAIVFGSLLFIARATDYAASGLFVFKMVVVAAATLNALALRIISSGEISRLLSAGQKPPRRFRIAGGFSLVAWITALTLGRMVGYF
jgi:hypothetical protein